MIKRRLSGPNLTPLIDVVFILLLFFVLSTQFGAVGVKRFETAQEGVAATDSAPYLVELGEKLRVNGYVVTSGELEAILSERQRIVAVRPEAGIKAQELLDFVDRLKMMGFERIVMVAGL